ncbi:MAG: hypothetical protein WDN23_18600 [Edaphobacter sp.]
MRRMFFAVAFLPAAPVLAQATFIPGNLVVAVEGCGIYSGTCTSVPNGTGTGALNSSVGGYGDNQAAPLTLFQFAPEGTTGAVFVNSLVLPQTATGVNSPVSGEYGSSSEATLQLSGTGQFLSILGYGVNANAFNANPPMFGAAPSNALGQSGSLTGQSYTAVPRVLALIDANGNVSSSTAVFNIYNTNNPRSVFSASGTTAYFSGQGSGSDLTGGVFYVPVGVTTTTPTAITGADTSSNTIAQDTRDVQIVNDTLYVSVDTKEGSGAARSYLGTLGTAGTPPTTTVGPPAMLNSFGNSGGTGKVTITTGANGNGNGLNAGLQINLSPESYFFATKAILYVADGGNGKQNSATSPLGNGGLQKWINSEGDGSGTWSLAYTLHQNLNLVANSNKSGISGLYGLTGEVQGSVVNLYATDETLSDLDTTHLYGITDTLSNTTASEAAGEAFSVLATAPQDSNFKGVAFAPTVAAMTLTETSSFAVQSNGSYVLTLTVTNNGAGTAEDVTITGVTVGGVSGSTLPAVIGPIAPGAAATATFTIPSTAGAPGATVVEKVTGTFAGGSITNSVRAKLP